MRFYALWLGGAAVATALLSAAVVDLGRSWDTLVDGAESDELVFVLLGLLMAVFASGAVVGWSLTPLASRLESEAAGLLRAGLYVGWLERLLVFLFLCAGEPGAAALALTAKSVARFPAFRSGEEPLAEYILIGTLASFTFATLAAMGTRALLHLPVL